MDNTQIGQKLVCKAKYIYVLIITLCFRCGGWVSWCSDITDVYKLYLTSKLFTM